MVTGRKSSKRIDKINQDVFMKFRLHGEKLGGTGDRVFYNSTTEPNSVRILRQQSILLSLSVSVVYHDGETRYLTLSVMWRPRANTVLPLLLFFKMYLQEILRKVKIPKDQVTIWSINPKRNRDTGKEDFYEGNTNTMFVDLKKKQYMVLNVIVSSHFSERRGCLV